MVFSDTNNRQGLIQECERICGLGAGSISGDTELLKDFTARLNNAKDRWFSLAFQYDALWNFDSTKQSDLPIATTNLVSGTKEYALTLFHTEVLVLTQLFAKDPSGVFHELKAQEDKENPTAYTLTNANDTPTTYELVGNSLLLDPTPNYNSTGGLKLVFKRNDTNFAYTDGGVPVGIPSLFHAYLAREASLSFASERGLRNSNDIALMVVRDENAIKEFISNRAKPKRLGLRITAENNH